MIYGYVECDATKSKSELMQHVNFLKNNTKIDYRNIYIDRYDLNNLNLLVGKCVSNDTIVISSLNKLLKEPDLLQKFLKEATEKKIKLVLGNITFDFTNKIYSVTENLVNSVVKNYKCYTNFAHNGRPKLSKKKLPKKFISHLDSYVNGDINKTEFAKLVGCHRSTIYRYLKTIKQ